MNLRKPLEHGCRQHSIACPPAQRPFVQRLRARSLAFLSGWSRSPRATEQDTYRRVRLQDQLGALGGGRG